MLNIFRALLALANCLFFVGAIHAQAISQGIPNSVNPDAYPGDPIGFVNAVLGKPADQHVSQISTWKLGDAETIARHHISVLNRMNEITSAFKSWCSANKGVQTLTKGIPWHDPCLAENGSPVALFTVGFDSTMFVQVETQNIAVTRYNERTRVLQKLLEKAKDEKLGIPVLYFQRTGVIPRYAFGKWVAKGIQTMETNKDVPMLSGLIPVFYIPRLFVSSERFIPLLTDYSLETKPSDDRYFTYIRYKPLPAMFAGDGASNGWIVGCVPGKFDRANCYNFVRVSEYRLSFNQNKPGLHATSNGISGNILFSAQGKLGDGLKIISEEEYLAMESKDAVIEAENAIIRQENEVRQAERRDLERKEMAASAAEARLKAITFIKNASYGTTIFCNSGGFRLLMPGENINETSYKCTLTGEKVFFRLEELLEMGWDIVSENLAPVPTITGNTGFVVNLRLKRLSKVTP